MRWLGERHNRSVRDATLAPVAYGALTRFRSSFRTSSMTMSGMLSRRSAVFAYLRTARVNVAMRPASGRHSRASGTACCHARDQSPAASLPRPVLVSSR